MKTLLTTLALGATIATSANAAIFFTGSYSENFDSVGSAGTAAPTDWSVGNFDAVLGGSSAVPGSANAATNDTMTVNDGTSGTKGRAYNYGTTGASDRALGSIGTTSPGAFAVQGAFTNDTGSVISSLRIAYTGEQWHRHTQINTGSGLGYKVYISTLNGGSAYTNLGSALDFDFPTNIGGSQTALDGNAAANRESFDVTVDLTAIGFGPIADGSDFFITWVDVNNGGNDHGIAVDDVSITTVPEPSSAALLGLGGIALILRRRK